MATGIQVSTTTYQTEDRSWLIDDVKLISRASGIIDFSLFTSGTHYPNGFLPSGLVLGRVTVGGKLGPYNDGALDGRQTAVGLLYNATEVPSDLARVFSVVFIDSFAAVTVAKLPSGNGLDTNGRADLPLIKFR